MLKPYIFFGVLILVGLSVESVLPFKPATVNEVNMLRVDDGPSRLERTAVTIDRHTDVRGTLIEAPSLPVSSSVLSHPMIHYTVRLSPGALPEQTVELFRLNSTPGGRADEVQLKFTKLNEDVYEIASANPLTGGKYVFVVNASDHTISNQAARTGYAFSI